LGQSAEHQKDLLPFLKWAGGKRWLASGHPSLFPQDFDRYIEPFVGSGAVFFRLAPRSAILSDSNRDLVETYQAIKDDYRLVRRYLLNHKKNHSKDYYYEVRSAAPKSKFSRAARFIYLNRTCWNALYRVNLKGEFNVPKGTKDSVSLPTDDFRATARKLRRAELLCSDFEDVISMAGDGDFIFADPPYTVKHNLNGFVKYNEQIFGWDDQVRLRDSLMGATNRGAQVMLTNANHESIRELYRNDFDISYASRNSVIAASAENRSKISELIITSMDP
jgi:DNA adenine methylase